MVDSGHHLKNTQEDELGQASAGDVWYICSPAHAFQLSSDFIAGGWIIPAAARSSCLVDCYSSCGLSRVCGRMV